jgi:hypothetical protein
VFVFHSAALTTGAEAVLLPGMPGSGKSTLAGALMNSGLSYCTDELVVLDDEVGQVQPAAVSIGLKEGAWEVLAPYAPCSHALPIHLRADGRAIRYLPPLREALPAGHHQRYGVRAIVFPPSCSRITGMRQWGGWWLFGKHACLAAHMLRRCLFGPPTPRAGVARP